MNRAPTHHKPFQIKNHRPGKRTFHLFVKRAPWQDEPRLVFVLVPGVSETTRALREMQPHRPPEEQCHLRDAAVH